MPLTKATCHNVFEYHAPDSDQEVKIKSVRQAAEDFAHVILDCCPNCADKTDALRKVREAMMTANAAIVLRGEV